MIFDCHTHLGNTNRFHLKSDAGALLRAADRAGIERMLVTDFTALTYDMDEGNEYLLNQIRPHRDRLIGYFTVSSGRFGQRATDELERYVTDHGFRGLKIYSTPPLRLIDEPFMIPLLEKAAELKVHVLAHSTGAECVSLCHQVPTLTIINAHMGCCPQGHGDWHLSVAAAMECPGIYLDTASSSCDNGMIEFAVENVGAERVLFGSDSPLLDPLLQVAKVTETSLTIEQKALILGGNIERILGAGYGS